MALSHPKIDAALKEGVASGAVPGVVAMAATGKDRCYEGAFGVRLGLGQPSTAQMQAGAVGEHAGVSAGQDQSRSRLDQLVKQPLGSVEPVHQ